MCWMLHYWPKLRNLYVALVKQDESRSNLLKRDEFSHSRAREPQSRRTTRTRTLISFE